MKIKVVKPDAIPFNMNDDYPFIYVYLEEDIVEVDIDEMAEKWLITRWANRRILKIKKGSKKFSECFQEAMNQKHYES